MSHVFFNVNVPNDIDYLLLKNKRKLEFNILNSYELKLYYDFREWSVEPYIESENSSLYISGWFVLDGIKNDLSLMKQVLDDGFSSGGERSIFQDIWGRISSGIFLGIYVNKGDIFVFSDPFSLSSHFYSNNSDLGWQISPYAKLIGRKPNVLMSRFLEMQGHLFGKYTSFNNVFRLLPRDVLCDVGGFFSVVSCNFDISSSFVSNSEVVDIIRAQLELWPSSNLSLALSAGFDSRLISTVCNPHFTYTWGPSTSLDQVVASKISSYKESKHLSFKYKEIVPTDLDLSLCEQMFSGVVSDYNPQFFANYQFVNDMSLTSHVALDGYLGDVLQRGVYLNFGGLKGELIKLFPNLLPISMNCFTLLRNRYKKVDDTLFSLVYSDFLDKTSHLPVEFDELNKVTFYEFLYGRGFRYINTGAIVMNSVFKTVVPCFATRDVFSSLIMNSSSDIVTYKVFKEVWEKPEQFYRVISSEGLYSPSTFRVLIPFINFVGRLITNKVPKYYNYTRE